MQIGVVTRREQNPKLLKALESIKNWAKGKKDKIIFASDKRLQECDVLIAVGGDGTVLSAAHIAYQKHIPIVGINAGRIGFLAEYKLEEIHFVLDALSAGNFITGERIMLDCSIYLEKKKVITRTVLNEIFIHAHAPERMVNLEVKINNRFLTEYWADSLILATPTGSTAYNLAAGGPIIHPSAEAFVLTPVNSMSLSVRPIVIPSNSECKIKCVSDSSAEIVFDGHFTKKLNKNMELRIKRSLYTTCFAHIKNLDKDLGFVKALRGKLGWTGKVNFSKS